MSSYSLFDAKTEGWNKHRHPSRPATHKVVNGERVTWLDEDDSMTVDPEAVCAFITCTFPSMFLDTQHMTGIASPRRSGSMKGWSGYRRVRQVDISKWQSVIVTSGTWPNAWA